MPRRTVVTATLALLVMGLSMLSLTGSCATIFKGSSEKVSFSSDPPSAKVYVNGSLMGNAPLELKLESKRSYTIEFRQEGYDSKTVMITNSIGVGWVVLDFLFGFWPIVIDAATGNWNELDQTSVNAVLEKQQR